jgi:phage-related minor tail protein
MSGAFARGIVDGRRFEDVLRGVGRSLSQGLLKSALAPLQSGIAGLLTGGLGGLVRGVGSGGSVPVMPFADGGVIASPAFFPLGRGLGLMGERGAEAILPLARGADGRLGVRSSAGGEARRPVAVTVQIATPDVDGFRRSEAQVAATIARAVARGSRAL